MPTLSKSSAEAVPAEAPVSGIRERVSGRIIAHDEDLPVAVAYRHVAIQHGLQQFAGALGMRQRKARNDGALVLETRARQLLQSAGQVQPGRCGRTHVKGKQQQARGQHPAQTPELQWRSYPLLDRDTAPERRNQSRPVVRHPAVIDRLTSGSGPSTPW